MLALADYYQRFTMYKLPSREVVVSVFLPPGPLGRGGHAIMRLGQVIMKFLPTDHY